MTAEAQRIAIAEVCGWKNIRHVKTSEFGTALVGSSPDGASDFRDVPDYFKDLNACVEMEATLVNQASKECYAREIYLPSEACIWGSGGEDPEWDELWHIIHLTPKQRCEAFLRTHNLWKEEVGA